MVEIYARILLTIKKKTKETLQANKLKMTMQGRMDDDGRDTSRTVSHREWKRWRE